MCEPQSTSPARTVIVNFPPLSPSYRCVFYRSPLMHHYSHNFIYINRVVEGHGASFNWRLCYDQAPDKIPSACHHRDPDDNGGNGSGGGGAGYGAPTGFGGGGGMAGAGGAGGAALWVPGQSGCDNVKCGHVSRGNENGCVSCWPRKVFVWSVRVLEVLANLSVSSVLIVVDGFSNWKCISENFPPCCEFSLSNQLCLIWPKFGEWILEIITPSTSTLQSHLHD